jgi:hypothetical protein
MCPADAARKCCAAKYENQAAHHARMSRAIARLEPSAGPCCKIWNSAQTPPCKGVNRRSKDTNHV